MLLNGSVGTSKGYGCLVPAPEVRLRRGLTSAVDFQELVACRSKGF